MAKPSGAKKQENAGSMTLFWVVIAAAGGLLLFYLLVTAMRLGKVMPSFDAAAGGGMALPEQRSQMPSFDLEEISGGPNVSSESSAGKVVVLHGWASWCQPCRSEFPAFAEYAAREASDDVVVVPLSLDANPGAAAAFLQGVGRPLYVYWDGEHRLADKLGINSIPTTILVDRQGRIAYKGVGAQDWGGGGIPDLIRQLVDEF